MAQALVPARPGRRPCVSGCISPHAARPRVLLRSKLKVTPQMRYAFDKYTVDLRGPCKLFDYEPAYQHVAVLTPAPRQSARRWRPTPSAASRMSEPRGI